MDGYMTAKSITIVCAGLVMAAAIFAYFSLTVFVIQPIGALPEGRTLVTKRVGKTSFLDSADAICEREMGGVSLLCRSMMMGKILEETTVYFRLPYSETLYLWSTGGREYGR
ncbi:MAG: hypothetical protein ACI92Z_001485 [Paracoccaceae bacterium]|jgi:hypothetical protein